MTPLLLAVLALTDAAFAGFRAAAGRSPAVHKVEYFLQAVWTGVGVGLLAIAAGGAWVVATAAFDPVPMELYGEFVRGADRMLTVYIVYATVVLLGLAVWTLPVGEHRTLSSVVVLGPLTLLRPAVIVAGAIWTVAGELSWQVRVGACIAVGAQLCVSLVLERIQARRQRELLARLYAAGPR